VDVSGSVSEFGNKSEKYTRPNKCCTRRRWLDGYSHLPVKYLGWNVASGLGETTIWMYPARVPILAAGVKGTSGPTTRDAGLMATFSTFQWNTLGWSSKSKNVAGGLQRQALLGRAFKKLISRVTLTISCVTSDILSSV
jgi:hypothetical protein